MSELLVLRILLYIGTIWSAASLLDPANDSPQLTGVRVMVGLAGLAMTARGRGSDPVSGPGRPEGPAARRPAPGTSGRASP